VVKHGNGKRVPQMVKGRWDAAFLGGDAIGFGQHAPGCWLAVSLNEESRVRRRGIWSLRGDVPPRFIEETRRHMQVKLAAALSDYSDDAHSILVAERFPCDDYLIDRQGADFKSAYACA
jgi:hypothetical protein